MTTLRIAMVVSGHGEVEAVPILVRRLVEELEPTLYVELARPPVRVSESKVAKPGELERAVELAVQKAPGGGVLVLLDCDDGCPAVEGPKLLARAEAARPGAVVEVVLAKREFESWFLAAADSLRGKRSLAADLARPADPESIRGAKEWLTRHRTDKRAYQPVLDQPALASVLDLTTARQHSDSFAALSRRVARMLARLRGAAPPDPIGK